MNTTQMSDQLLRQYVDGIFERYDLDHSNTLTLNELVVFFNDLLASRGATQKMSSQQVQNSLKAMDTNNDGQITKVQLYNALKKMNAQSNIFSQNTQDNIYPSLSNVNPVQSKQYAKPNQFTNYYNKPQIYTGLNGATNQYKQPIAVSPQSYEALPLDNLRNQNNYNYVKTPKTQKQLKRKAYGQDRTGYAPTIVPTMMPSMGPSMYPPMSMGYPPMIGIGMGMGSPFGMNPLIGLLGGLFGLGRFF